MAELAGDKWVLWIFAGPGALGDEAPVGQPLPLERVIGQLPEGVGLFAETVGAPTVLQRLTGEWPTQRLRARGHTVERVEDSAPQRDLLRFVEWAERQTPKGAKRALIVLGDLLQAIGEEPKAKVPGGDRPPYPTQIKITKKSSPTSTMWTQKTTNASMYTSSGSSDTSFANLIAKVNTVGDKVTLTFPSIASAHDGEYTLKTSGDYPFSKSGNLAGTYKIADNASATSNGDKVTLSQPPKRSIDELGPVQVSLATRRIDALARTLSEHQVELIAADELDLARLVSLRRLASCTQVSLAYESAMRTGQPLRALLRALQTDASVGSEELAKRGVEASAKGSTAIALRSAGAGALRAALGGLAQEVQTVGLKSPVAQRIRAASQAGEDLGTLSAALEQTAVQVAARQVLTAASEATIARSGPERSSGAEAGACVLLDSPGLDLGPSSDWTDLLEQLNGPSNAANIRRTLQDLQAMTARRRRLESRAPATAPRPSAVIEYPDAAHARSDLSPIADFERFLRGALGGCEDARHVVLLIRGQWSPARPGSVLLDAQRGDFLPLAALASGLRYALGKHGRGPLAMIVFDDPELLRVENAYELHDVAHVLLTSVVGVELPPRDQIAARVAEVVVEREQRAAASLGAIGDSIALVLREWRHQVAVRLAKLLLKSDPDEPQRTALQGLDLHHMESLCRRFDSLCQRMFDALEDPGVLAASKAPLVEPAASSVVELINGIQMQGFLPYAQAEGWSELSRRLHNDWGSLYNWISVASASVGEAGSPFWIDPDFVEDRDPAGYCSRLRVTLAPQLSDDYRALAFHAQVRLQALLTAARVLDRYPARPLWGLLSLGLAHAPDRALHGQMARLLDDASSADYFTALGPPPLLSLSIEPDRTTEGYDLHLSSTESAAAIVHQHRRLDLGTTQRSLEDLSYVLSNSSASREGWDYVESIGASLAEDVINELRGDLERERQVIRELGRARGVHLSLALPRELMRYPWELMTLPGCHAQLPETLAERFAIGRQMWSEREVRRAPSRGRVRMLVIADPPSYAPELPGAREEGEAVRRLCARMTEEVKGATVFECEAIIGETLTRSVFRRLLRDGEFDVIHFAGHGTYDAAQPDHSGWLLSDGLLSATELYNTLMWSPAPPRLIFGNGCDLGMMADPPAYARKPDQPPGYTGEVYGIAGACIRAGVSSFIAPMWEIQDDSARILATEFYSAAFVKRATIGVALQQARQQVRKVWEGLRGDAGLGDISWAGMVLFGNPCARFDPGHSGDEAQA